jgi:heat shock protein HslJ
MNGTIVRLRSWLARGAAVAALVQSAAPASASTPQAWAELDARSAAECARVAKLDNAKVGAPLRFGDELGIDVRVVTGTVPHAPHDAAPVAMLCAFQRGSGRVEVIEAPEAAMLTALPAAPEIRGITWRAEDIGGRGLIDRSRVTLVLAADGRVSGIASCNAYTGRYTLDGGSLAIGELTLASAKSCAPSLANQERRFVEVLGAVRRVELLPTGALLVSGPGSQSARFFPETPR